MNWKKEAGDLWSAQAGPFSLKVAPKADGRWTWEVFDGETETENPSATGIARSLGAAKTVSAQYVNRSGRV